MSRRIPVILLLGVLAVTVACTNKKVSNPIANVDSKQPDKVLFDRAMDAMKHNRFDVARLSLQTLINTYPDSEYVARAKLAVADSWYAEGGSASLAQAEIEYKDFETFFPNMPEAAEAQLKLANIHYQQMEKADRDPTHALRAEEEYRQLIMQYPDSKLVPEAKQRLREVQEVIASREFSVGRFYYLRQSYPAAIARLKSLVDKYPLYSKADEALYLLGQSYEGEINMLRARTMNEVAKSRMIDDFTKGAAEAYDRILTRYPVMDRADDAKARLIALHQPVPKPTKAAVAQNKAEEDSRREASTLSKMMKTFAKHPNTAEAAKVGEPTLVDPTPMSASQVVQQATRAAMGGGGDSHSVSVETVKSGTPGPDQPAPRSDSPAAADAAVAVDTTATPDTAAPPPSPQPDANELKPNSGPADPNELKPNVSEDNGQALPPPQQVNEISGAATAQTPNNGTSATTTANQKSADSSASSSTDKTDDTDSTQASSKHKKKKGIHKIVPF
ncbi:MAG TPA: outer membrane protein assembly factor BamD [Terriglobales bacterium]|jgi:outer membrane protein assembly factor BamD|nr:outer membrane protein assembly factor BamD [Terriglobales bacterium]